jgi:hypothetical protein
MVRITRSALSVVLCGLAACTTIDSQDEAVSGVPPLCKANSDLGFVVVAPLTHWRADQKEPKVREAIAEAAIKSSFAELSCARSMEIRSIAVDQTLPQAFDQARHANATTLVVVTIRELGPIVNLSFPVLWSGWSDVAFDFKAIDLESGRSVLELSRHRQVGGAFNLRGLGPLQAEFEAALKPLLRQ